MSRSRTFLMLSAGLVSATLGLAGLFSTTGCSEDCVYCELGGEGIYCKTTFQYQPICAVDLTTAYASCYAIGGIPVDAPECPKSWGETLGDDGSSDGTEGSPSEAWDPLGSITYESATNTYIIDADFVQALQGNPNLMLLDDTILMPSPASGYYVVAAAGDFSTAMGWQQGDELRSVNRHSLQGLADILDAYLALSSETEFALRIKRGNSWMSLSYEIQ